MRQDIYNVIHDTVRGSYPAKVVRTERLVDGESMEPVRQNMRHARRLGNVGMPNLRLQPLRRFVDRRVGQRWSDVYAELRQGLRRRDATLDDPLRYLSVEVNTSMVDGEVVAHSHWGGLHPVEEHCDYYVHPVTGLLCRTARLQSRRESRRQDHAREQAQLHARRRVVSQTSQLHRLEGIWYEVTLAPLASEAVLKDYDAQDWVTRIRRRAEVCTFDVVAGRNFYGGSYYELTCLYGQSGVYAKSKRQLSHAELKTHGLLQAH